jgi:hypothetical protein
MEQEIEQQSKMLMLQSLRQPHRKTSNVGSRLRASLINNTGKIFNHNGDNGLVPHNCLPVEIDYNKVLQKINTHNECLQLIITVYYKSSQFYKLLVRSIDIHQ